MSRVHPQVQVRRYSTSSESFYSTSEAAGQISHVPTSEQNMPSSPGREPINLISSITFKETQTNPLADLYDSSSSTVSASVFHPRISFSFRTSLLTAMIILTLTPVLILLILSISFSVFSSVNVEEGVVIEALSRADSYVSDFLNVCKRLTKIQKQLILDYYYTQHDTDDYFHGPQNYANMFKSLSLVHRHNKDAIFLVDFTPTNGEYYYVNTAASFNSSSLVMDEKTSGAMDLRLKNYDATQELYMLTHPDENTTIATLYNLTDNGVLSMKETNLPYDNWDPRGDEYYQLSLRYPYALVPINVQLQGSNIEEKVYVCFQENLYSKLNSSVYLGVTSVNVVIRELATFVKSFQVSANGFAAIMEISENLETGELRKRLVAYKDYSVLVLGDEENGFRIPNAEEIPNVFLKDILISQIPSTKAEILEKKRRVMRYVYNSNLYILSYDVVTASLNLNMQWIVFISAPEIDFNGNMVLLACLNIGVSIMAAIVTVIFVFYISSAISKPLLFFANESKAISKLEVQKGNVWKSKIREINVLSEAFSKMKTTLRSFLRFVPKQLIVEMVERGIDIKLGGAEFDNITLLFSDVEDFTKYSEQLAPIILIKQLGEYFHVMTEEIINTGGTLDKYIGDAVMAFWGAPSYLEDSQLRACTAAFKCQIRMKALREKWQEKGRAQFKCRIGLHSGSCVIGNLGSIWRIQYTAIGDNVNLASRLESLNKSYATEVLVSEVVASKPDVQKEFIFRKIDTVSVKGKSVGCTVYELISDQKSRSNYEHRIKLVQPYEDALNEYLAGQFTKALTSFKTKCVPLDPTDKATQTMMDRCAHYIVSPPDVWDGVHRNHEK
ncbi:hypothetical protein C9374_008629 [Naegleria lovaniensis]|uniref:Guanylate cyclase domain-containing protein n=1 Tax=Naegleria lovaniensis TaxID=51637 RepID=A0AA88GEJ1_NAELO|nr:uncharacterized protein C9374_008629 [Naegleria lovaniensis]KAG2378007.1 hypothetical protein C9374_008629 [Naegleria lovaniensis]